MNEKYTHLFLCQKHGICLSICETDAGKKSYCRECHPEWQPKHEQTFERFVPPVERAKPPKKRHVPVDLLEDISVTYLPDLPGLRYAYGETVFITATLPTLIPPHELFTVMGWPEEAYMALRAVWPDIQTALQDRQASTLPLFPKETLPCPQP